MKRFAILLLILLLLTPATLHADVAWEAPDRFIEQYREQCHSFPSSRQDYIALCDFYSYTSPLTPTQRLSITKGSSLLIKWYYMDAYGRLWGLWGGYDHPHTSWVPMDAVAPVYGPDDYLADHASSIQPYAGEKKHRLPTQEDINAIADYRRRTDGGDGRGGNPPVWSMFDFPYYTAWRYPDSPDCYINVWSPDIVPLHILTNESYTTWVYAQHLQDPDYTFWVNFSDPTARPDPKSPVISQPAQEAPTHLPVPGQEELAPVSRLRHLQPVYPVILAVLSVVLLSAVLLIVFMRKKEA